METPDYWLPFSRTPLITRCKTNLFPLRNSKLTMVIYVCISKWYPKSKTHWKQESSLNPKILAPKVRHHPLGAKWSLLTSFPNVTFSPYTSKRRVLIFSVKFIRKKYSAFFFTLNVSLWFRSELFQIVTDILPGQTLNRKVLQSLFQLAQLLASRCGERERARMRKGWGETVIRDTFPWSKMNYSNNYQDCFQFYSTDDYRSGKVVSAGSASNFNASKFKENLPPPHFPIYYSPQILRRLYNGVSKFGGYGERQRLCLLPNLKASSVLQRYVLPEGEIIIHNRLRLLPASVISLPPELYEPANHGGCYTLFRFNFNDFFLFLFFLWLVNKFYSTPSQLKIN